MIAPLPKLQQALEASNGATTKSARDNLATTKTQAGDSRASNEKLADANGASLDIKNPVFKGDPEDQVIVFDLDETLIAGDKNPITAKRQKEIEAKGDRKVETVPKDHPLNKRGREIKYVLRPGAQELLEYLHSRGYKMVACTRNYSDRAEAICEHDPVLSKYISGSVGRTELQDAENKDFKKYPNHPDKLGFWKRFKGHMHNTFFVFPKFMWLKFKSIFNGANIRWTAEVGSLGKYPPNIIELLKSKGNHKLDNCKPARFLVDNSDKRETRDALKCGDWTYVNSNVDSNGDGKRTPFFAADDVIKIDLKDPDTGETKQGYKWVKKVIDDIEMGWRAHYKQTFGKEPKTAA